MSDDIWSIVLLSGVVSWIVSTIAFMFFSFPRKDEFDAKSGMRWGGASLISFFVWIIGMINA